MNDQIVTAPEEPLTGPAERTFLTDFTGTLVGLVIGLGVIGILFQTEIMTAGRTWYLSTAYNHCFLVIPIVLWLLWDRAPLIRIAPRPAPWAALLAIPLGFGWLVAERLGVMEGRQLIVISLAQVLFLALLGVRLYRAVLGPLLYLYFLVPFGEFLTPKLQDITTWFSRHGLEILGIPAYIDGYIIEIKEGTFFVAEACAGLRFLIAAIAFGVLYALLMYRSPVRRTAFIVASIIVPIIANGFRALGIVYLGHVLGSAEAAAADHVLYGWIFFSVVILMLIAVGMPFREDTAPRPIAAPREATAPGAFRFGVVASVAVALLAAIGPAAAYGLNRAAVPSVLPPTALTLPSSCLAAEAPAPAPASARGRSLLQHVYCGGTEFNIQIEVFSPRVTAGPVTAERRRLTRIPDADDISEAPFPVVDDTPLPGWRMVRTNEPAAVSAVGLWIDGQPASAGLTTRLRLAQTSMTGSTHAPVLITITPAIDWPNAHLSLRRKQLLETALADLLRGFPTLNDQVMALAEAGAR